MRYQTISILVLGLLSAQSCSGDFTDINGDNTSEELTFIVNTMKDTISATPYSALVIHTGINVVSVADDDSVEKHIYQANVIETYRGQEFDDISYTMFVEKGEAALIIKDEFIVTLCVNHEGFYWPGTGSSFPATQDTLKIAKQISQNIESIQSSSSYCE